MAEISSISVEFVEDRLSKNLRAFAWGNVYEITYAQRPAILVLDHDSRTGTLYEYSSSDEYETDRRRVLDFGGGAGARVLADSLPPTPTLSGSAARDFPPTDDD